MRTTPPAAPRVLRGLSHRGPVAAVPCWPGVVISRSTASSRPSLTTTVETTARGARRPGSAARPKPLDASRASRHTTVPQRDSSCRSRSGGNEHVSSGLEFKIGPRPGPEVGQPDDVRTNLTGLDDPLHRVAAELVTQCGDGLSSWVNPLGGKRTWREERGRDHRGIRTPHAAMASSTVHRPSLRNPRCTRSDSPEVRIFASDALANSCCSQDRTTVPFGPGLVTAWGSRDQVLGGQHLIALGVRGHQRVLDCRCAPSWRSDRHPPGPACTKPSALATGGRSGVEDRHGVDRHRRLMPPTIRP